MQSYPKPQDCGSVDPIKFEAAYVLATHSHVEFDEVQESNPFKISEDAPDEGTHFTKIPIIRAILALGDCFAGSGDYFCATQRFWALIDVLCEDGLRKWVRTDPQDPKKVVIHPAVFHAAATLSLNPDGYFVIDNFLPELEKIQKEKFPSEK